MAVAQQNVRSPFKGVGARASTAGVSTISRHPQGARRLYAHRPKQRGSLRLFLDSADVSQWEKYQHGTLYGFTTNPTILERDKVPCTLKSLQYLVQQAHRLQAQEIQIQAWGSTAAAMEVAARNILDLDPAYITIKLPCTAEGLSAASALIASDPTTKITITGVYRTSQVLLAQSLGADYVAPYLGRMADSVEESVPDSSKETSEAAAMEAVADMQSIVNKSQSSLRILVASIRSAQQMAQLAAKGCDTFTFSPAVAEQLIAVPDTLRAAADFEAAAARNEGVDPQLL